MQSYIYNLRDPETMAVRYVGRTVRPKGRRADHSRPKPSDKTYKANWIRSILAKGLRPIFTVIQICASELAYEREQLWIAYYRAIGCRLTNLSDGGPGLINPPAEVRERKSRALMGHAVTDKTRRAVSLAHKGIPLTDEHKRKLSLSGKGKAHKNKGRALSDLHRAKISQTLIGNQRRTGIAHTDEAKAKMSKARKGVPKSAAWHASRAAAILRRREKAGAA